MPSRTLEERLTVVEEELAQLKKRLEPDAAPRTNPWLDQVFGVFQDDPLFEEAVRYGRAWRESQRMEHDEGADASSGH
jgi:hypothetical protein